jgi:hypothetical protein
MLDLIWAQQPGQEVVYEWVQWLQNSALSHLGFDDVKAIRHSDSMMGPIDVRAVGEVVPVESVIQWLISYNEERCHETFLSGLHDCMICLSEYAGNWNAPVNTWGYSSFMIYLHQGLNCLEFSLSLSLCVCVCVLMF